MKYLADHMLVRGINYFVPHAFSPKPDDPDCPPNFYATGANPQYKYLGRIMGYLNRSCHLLQGGVHVNTCAVLYDAENVWGGREATPIDLAAKAFYDNQLDFDIIPPEALGDIDDGGCINGEHYGLIVVPACDYIRPAVKEALQKCGMRIAVVGEYDKGDFEIVSLDALPGYVRLLGLSDVETASASRLLRYHHAMRGGAHIYMFTNEDTNMTFDGNISLGGFFGRQVHPIRRF